MTRRKGRSAASDAWICGYVCAVAILASQTDPLHTDVITLLESGCPTAEQARAAGAERDDIEQLTPSWQHIAAQDARWAARTPS
ncbi:hypothetical protein [Deinococcus soli (ex Cha et al. 2016)]|uniref:Uncharacterized protein n=2 Tax=Deinococcus soli (ex Cha et al. 2016) TaxID=1309411 RepID=A0AAE4BM56_9DEIO|nr:hypothetical protein [Deinococcus soli (ex Cha et al. 2016)]MDR6218152.1 hypothetical protein [Deinococcus soli (ex Cha et al. 2016)]MDR6328892.1 hypothetical protein [Deinococcus soli (ex Cha et al. 2016)]MDR6751620.1 hypothetical protein [Deinococcus soli (ex Cha et al. 2016)]